MAIGKAAESATQVSFERLKQLSLDLLRLRRMTSMVTSSLGPLSPLLTRKLERYVGNQQLSEAGDLSDFMANILAAPLEDRLRVLATESVQDRINLVNTLLEGYIKGLHGDNTITITTALISPETLDIPKQRQVDSEAVIPRSFLRSPKISMGNVKHIGNDNTDDEEEVSEIDELKKKVQEAHMVPEAFRVAEKELKRLAKMNPAQAEYGVCRTYIETLIDVPWTKETKRQIGKESIAAARKQLDDDHYGLERVKKRLLEYLAVLRLKQESDVPALPDRQILGIDDTAPSKIESEAPPDATQTESSGTLRRIDRSPILLLQGPPGTGKTSLARSVATALGRKFLRLSLGGVRDEAEIRGHRRTYVAAMPGLIINGLRKVGVNNPVFLLDEVDKVGGSSFHGDPGAALLEVLDPEQNFTFTDHYLNIPFDLSKVLFIATANTLDTISPPLLDRMETISLSGYTTFEKTHIAKRHLIPKQILSNGLKNEQIDLADAALDTIITAYTRESGVRNLEREIGSVCRFKAVQFAESMDNSALPEYKPEVLVSDIEGILGIERFEEEIAEKRAAPGIVTGLVAYSTGGQGSILFIEIADMPGSGNVQLTGKLGDVLKESVEVALTWVKAHALELGLTNSVNEDIMKQRSIHVHCPSGAIPKDGPSAGLAHTIALISLFSERAVPPELAMTGEVSLRGRVMAVGGIKEKLIGAHRAGVKTVLLPSNNRKDTKDLPTEVQDGLDIVYVSHIWDALKIVWPGDQHGPMVESRL